MSILLRTVSAAVVAFALTYFLMDEAMARDADLAHRLHANDEAVTARVASHHGRRGSCDIALRWPTDRGTVRRAAAKSRELDALTQVLRGPTDHPPVDVLTLMA